MRMFALAMATGVLIGFICVRVAEQVKGSNTPFQLAASPAGLTDVEQYRSEKPLEQLTERAPVAPPLTETESFSIARCDTFSVEYIDTSTLQPIRVISRGQRVDIRRYLSKRGRTVVMFTAPWCPGCRAIQPRLESLARNSPSLSLRIVDIGNWGTPVAKQYKIRTTPYLMLFHGKQLVAEGRDNVLQILGLIN